MAQQKMLRYIEESPQRHTDKWKRTAEHFDFFDEVVTLMLMLLFVPIDSGVLSINVQPLGCLPSELNSFAPFVRFHSLQVQVNMSNLAAALNNLTFLSE